VLVTGGAGYVGSILVPELLRKGCRVRVLDNLTFGGMGLLPNFSNPDFELFVGDVRSKKDLKKALKDIDAIVHLAAIVGYPACKKDPRKAWEVNYRSTSQLNKLRKPKQQLIFASTGSNFGHVVEEVMCNEDTPLNPITTYGKTKTKAELEIIKSPNVVIHRYATAFGLSPRLRLDLLVNDFTYQAYKQGYLLVYEKDYTRTFIHVKDMARAVVFTIQNGDKMNGEVCNVGNEKSTMSKEEIVNLLKKRMDFVLHYTKQRKDEDRRNYKVDFSKFRKLGFRTTVSIEDGIDEMIRAFRVVEIKNPYSNV